MLNVLIPSPQEIPFTPCVLISLSLSFSLSLSLGLLSSPSFPWRHLKPEVCLLCPPTIPSGYFWNKLMLLDESYKSTKSWNFQCGARIVSLKVLLQHCEQRCFIHLLYLMLDSHEKTMTDAFELPLNVSILMSASNEMPLAIHLLLSYITEV